MERVRSKLATWQWARENDAYDNDEDGSGQRLPLLPVSGQSSSHNSRTPSYPYGPRHELPLTPPNTQRNSATPSAKHSAPHTRPPSEEQVHFPMSPSPDEAEDDDPDDEPLELCVRPTFSRPQRPAVASRKHASDSIVATGPQDYLSVPVNSNGHSGAESPDSPCGGSRDVKAHTKAISRQLSNLAVEEAQRFGTHRDSVELMRSRERVTKEMMNQELMGTRDSFVLNRARVGLLGRVKEKERGLSPIESDCGCQSPGAGSGRGTGFLRAWWEAEGEGGEGRVRTGSGNSEAGTG